MACMDRGNQPCPLSGTKAQTQTPQQAVLNTRELCDIIVETLSKFKPRNRMTKVKIARSKEFINVPVKPTAGEILLYRGQLLAAVGLVTRPLQEAALDCHWKMLPSLFYLLRTIPVLKYDEERNSWTFSDNLDASNMERFCFYARRIRSVDLRDSSTNIPPEAYMEIQGYLASSMEQAFQKLRTLTIHDLSEATNTALLFLLPPCGLPITTVNISVNGRRLETPFTASIFARIKKASQTLRLLDITQTKRAVKALERTRFHLPWASLQLAQLQTLRLDCACHPRTCVAALSPNLPSLATMEIITHPWPDSEDGINESNEGGGDNPAQSFTFDSLTTFIIKGADKHVHAWLKSLNLSTIETLSITLTALIESNEPLAVLLASQGTSLRSLDVRGTKSDEAMYQSNLPWRDFEAFGQLPSLETLSVTGVQWLASSWKELNAVFERFLGHLSRGDRLHSLTLPAVAFTLPSNRYGEDDVEIPVATSILRTLGKYAPPALRSVALPLYLPWNKPRYQGGHHNSSSVEWRSSIESIIVRDETFSRRNEPYTSRYALFEMRATAQLLATAYPRLETLRCQSKWDVGRWAFVEALIDDHIELLDAKAKAKA